MKKLTPCASLLLTAVVVAGCSRPPRVTTTSSEALQLYTGGVRQLEKFYYAEAETLFEHALQYDSTFAMAWARLAMVNSMNQNEPEALADIGRAVRHAQHATQRERLFIDVWDHRLRFDYRQATEAVDSLIRLYPDDAEAYMLRGNLYEMEKDPAQAIKSYQSAVAKDTGYALAVMYLGYAYSTNGEQDKAIEQMQRYIRLAPDAADPRASYADLLLRVGRYDEALGQYRKSLALKPDYWYSIRQIGIIDAIKGKLRDAADQYHASARLLPMNRQLEATYLSFDANLDLLRGKYDAALAQFNEALGKDTTNFNAAFGAVYALGKLKRFQEADNVVARIRQEFGRRNLLESPAMLDFHLMVSRLLTAQGKYPEALAECEMALDFSLPLTRTAVYYQMAEIHREQRSYEPALDACSEALSINPNQPEALLTLARIYHERRDRAMTEEIGNRLLTLWSGADPDYQNLIELRRLLGMHPPA